MSKVDRHFLTCRRTYVTSSYSVSMLWLKQCKASSVPQNESGSLSDSSTRTISRLSLCSEESSSCSFFRMIDFHATTALPWSAIHMQPYCPQAAPIQPSGICSIHHAGISRRTLTHSTASKNGLVQASTTPTTELIHWMDMFPPLLQDATHLRIAVSLPIISAPLLQNVHVQNAILS